MRVDLTILKCAMAILAVFLFDNMAMADRPADFGQQWVRSNPLTISALAQDPTLMDGDLYTGAGLNTFLAWKRPDQLLPTAVAEDLPWHFAVNESVLTPEVMNEITTSYENYPGNTGWLIRDEPRRLDMENVAELTDWVKQQYPDSLAYTNAFPIGADATEYYGDNSNPSYGYSDYLNDIMTIIRPDVLAYDLYPLGIGGGPGQSGFFYLNMMAVREVAQTHEVPYWSFVQSYEKLDTPDRRLPSDSDLRFMMFSHLAAGYTGFHYFGYDPGWPGLVDHSGNPTSAHVVAGPVNAEVALVGHAMRALESTDVRYITNTGNTTPSGISNWSIGAGGDPFINHLAVDTNPIYGDSFGAYKDGMIGFFTDDNGERFFMVTNVYHDEDLTAEEALLHFEIRFDPSITEILMLDNHTGETVVLTFDVSNTLRIAIPGGTGYLFKYNTGVGFPAIPEPATAVLFSIGAAALAFGRKSRCH